MKKFFIIGTGMIGGSLALSLKKIYPNAEITGFDNDESQLLLALKSNIIDNYTLNIVDVKNSDLIIIAVPVGQFKDILYKIKPHLNAQIIIDVGSTKVHVINDVKAVLGANFSNFVPTHPIAGKEKSGNSNADEKLFNNKKVIICPMPNNTKRTINLIVELWQKTGANIKFMDAVTHDKIFAITSHLPHVVAFSFMNYLATHKEISIYKGGGLKDFIRIAGSNPTMWHDIIQYNQDNIIKYLEEYIIELTNFKQTIKTAKDHNKVAKYIEKSNKYYNSIK